MSTHEVWAATKKIADCWEKSQVVVDFRRETDLIVADLDNPAAIPALLHLTKRSTREFYSQPTRLYRAFPHLGISLTQRDWEFSSKSAAIDRSLIYLIWWIRSKLPGFPTMPVPQLAANSYHVKYDPDMPWAKETLPGGIEYARYPAFCDATLGVEAGGAPNELAEAFLSLESWIEFKELYQQLDSSTTAELTEAQQLLGIQATAAEGEAGNDYADPTVHWNRSRAMTADVLTGLSPFAAKFASTFELVNAEINRTMHCVLSQLVAFGAPRHLIGLTELEVKPVDPPVISFQLESQACTGGIYWTDDSLIDDAVMIESFSFGGSQVHGDRNSASAVVLSGTSTAWHDWRGSGPQFDAEESSSTDS